MRLRPRVRVVVGLVAGLMTVSTAAYAWCLCCPWTIVEGCQADSGQQCSYAAGVPGDIAGVGTWHVHIDRGLSNFDYEGHGGTGRTSYPNVIKAGDVVTVTAAAQSCVLAGANADDYFC